MDDNAVEVVQQVLAETRWTGHPFPVQYLPALARDVLYALQAKFAVVALPEPSYIDDPECNGAKGYGFNGPGGLVTTLAEHGVYAYDGRIFDQYDGWTPEEARTIASWWLAAANAAEVSE